LCEEKHHQGSQQANMLSLQLRCHFHPCSHSLLWWRLLTWGRDNLSLACHHSNKKNTIFQSILDGQNQVPPYILSKSHLIKKKERLIQLLF